MGSLEKPARRNKIRKWMCLHALIESKNVSVSVSIRLRKLGEVKLLILALGLYSSIFSLFLFSRYDSFQSGYYDLGIFSRAIFSASQNPSRITALVLPTKDSLIGHVDPFLLLLVPLYDLSPDPKLLLVVATVALGASIFPLYFLARNHLRTRNQALLFCGIYLLNPMFNNINRFDFQPLAFVPLLILSSLYFYEEGKASLFLSSIFLANSTHEFVALVTAVLGASLLVNNFFQARGSASKRLSSGQKIRSSILVWVIVISSAWFSFAYFVQKYYDPSTPLTNYLSVDPASSADYLGRMLYVALMFAPLVFLPLLEPLLLAPILPYMGVVLLGSHSPYWSVYYQYGAFTVSSLFYAALVAIGRSSFRLPMVVGGYSLKPTLGLLLVANALFATGFSALSPVSPVSWSFADTHDRVLASMLERIPRNVTIITQSQIYPHLTSARELSLYLGNLTLVDRVSTTVPDYVVFDTTQSSFYAAPSLFGLSTERSVPLSKALREVVSTCPFGLYTASDGAYVLLRDYQGPFVPSGARVSLPLNIGEDWSNQGNYSLVPFGVSLRGGRSSGGFFYKETLYANQTSFSLSFAIQESKSYGDDAWAGVVIGFKDFENYLLLYLRYSSGLIGLMEESNGVARDYVIGSTPYPTSDYQYFYATITGSSLQVYVNSALVATTEMAPSTFLGHFGLQNWQVDTTIQFLQFTEF